MKNKIFPLIILLMLVTSFVSMIPIKVHAFSTLLFDDFHGSSINGSVWSWQQQNTCHFCTGSNIPTLYDESPSIWIGLPRLVNCQTPSLLTCFGGPYYWDGLIANNTLVPAIQTTTNNTIRSIAVSMRLSNVTMNGSNFGNGTNVCGIGGCNFDAFVGFANHWTCNGCADSIPGGASITLEAYSQTIAPGQLTTKAYTTYIADLNGITGTVTKRFVTLDSIGAIDPLQPHVFQVSINIAGKNSWAAFMVDQMAVFNFTEISCSCIVGSGIQQTMYPVISYQGSLSPFFPSSLGAQIAYVMVTDYIATSAQLPKGIYPGPTCSTNPTPGSPLNPLGYCTIQRIPGVPAGSFASGITADQFFQSQAVVLGAGNVYFGGMFLTSLYLIASILITATITRSRFVLGFETLFVLTFFTILAIIPWYVMFMAGGMTMSIIFGVIPAGLGGKSGGRGN